MGASPRLRGQLEREIREGRRKEEPEGGDESPPQGERRNGKRDSSEKHQRILVE